MNVTAYKGHIIRVISYQQEHFGPWFPQARVFWNNVGGSAVELELEWTSSFLTRSAAGDRAVRWIRNWIDAGRPHGALRAPALNIRN